MPFLSVRNLPAEIPIERSPTAPSGVACRYANSQRPFVRLTALQHRLRTRRLAARAPRGTGRRSEARGDDLVVRRGLLRLSAARRAVRRNELVETRIVET